MAKLTEREFKSLERNRDRDIVNLYEVFYRLTDNQRERLSSDDWSRVEDYEEELRCELATFME